MEKTISAMRVHHSNYEFIKDCSFQHSNGSISGEIRKMLKYVDMNRADYFDKIKEVEKMMKIDKKDIDKNKRYEKLKKQREKIDRELEEYEDLEIL